MNTHQTTYLSGWVIAWVDMLLHIVCNNQLNYCLLNIWKSNAETLWALFEAHSVPLLMKKYTFPAVLNCNIWVWISLFHIYGVSKKNIWSYRFLTPSFRLTLRSIRNSPYCKPYNSCNVSSANLVLDQPIIPKVIFFLILITYLVDVV